jgi:hypothetical protein
MPKRDWKIKSKIESTGNRSRFAHSYFAHNSKSFRPNSRLRLGILFVFLFAFFQFFFNVFVVRIRLIFGSGLEKKIEEENTTV